MGDPLQQDQRFPVSTAGTDTQLKAQANQIAASAFGQPGTSKTTTPGQQFTTENVQNMTPASLAALEQLIATMQGGGTLQQKAEITRKKQTQDLIQGMLGQYSSGQAFTDAQGLMALNLQKAMETNMPQIQRSIEGAGTSAGSMQGLLAQNMARDSSLAASALGGEQAKAYGGITAQLTNQLSGMASSALDPVGQQLLAALGIAKGAVTNTQRTTSGGGQTEKIGGTLASASPFQSPTVPGYNPSNPSNPIDVLTKALGSNPFSTSTIGPTSQETANINSYKRAPGVYSDQPLPIDAYGSTQSAANQYNAWFGG